MKKLTLLLVSVLALSACGSDADTTNAPSDNDVADQIEDAIEDQSDGDVDVDIDDITGDTVVQFETEDGEGSVVAGGDIPDGWPIPIPSGGEVHGNLAVSEGDVSSGMVTVGYAPERFDELVSFYEEFFSQYSDTSKYSQSGSFMILSPSAGFTVSIELSDDGAELATMVTAGG